MAAAKILQAKRYSDSPKTLVVFILYPTLLFLKKVITRFAKNYGVYAGDYINISNKTS